MRRVTVIIPTFNAARFLPTALDSILSQEFRDFEVIVVDDGSTDDTAEVMRTYGGSAVRYVPLPENSGGCSKPRNVAIEQARGEFIALLDADDVWCPGHLAHAVAVFERAPHLGLVFTNCVNIDEDGQRFPGTRLDDYDNFHRIEKHEVGDHLFVIPRDVAFRAMFAEHFVGVSGAVIPRAVFARVGGFDEDLRNSEDRDMWYRIAREYDVGYVDAVDYHYRIRRGSMSSRGARLFQARIAVFRKQIRDGLPVDLQRQAKRLVARNFYSLGYTDQAEYRLREARENYVLSLREWPNVAALRGWCATWLGVSSLRWIKKALRRED